MRKLKNSELQRIEIDDFNENQKFQIKNLGLAIAATSHISGIDIITPLSKNIHQAVSFPGRFEKIEVGKFLFSIASVDQKRIKRIHVFRKS